MVTVGEPDGELEGATRYRKDVEPILQDHCQNCHVEGGLAPFSLMTYENARVRAGVIAGETTARRMPPWGAVKGFGEFRNDQGLTQEQVELVTNWVEGGIIKGNNPNMLPAAVRDLVAKFGLRGDIVFQKVGSLSGGEKSKVALAGVALSGNESCRPPRDVKSRTALGFHP